MKVAPSNSDIIIGTCSCKVASTHISSIIIINNLQLTWANTKSNKNLDKIKSQQNKNITEKIDSDKIN